MAFYDRDYDVYVILGSPDLPPLWHWDRWQIIVDLLAPFANVPRGKAALRGYRMIPNPSKPGFKKDQGLGRVSWDRKSQEKWAFFSPTTQYDSPHWLFSSIEAWAPSWNVCVRENLAPDFFFNMQNELRVVRSGTRLVFNPIITLAASYTLDEKYRDDFRKAATSIASFVMSPLFVYRMRPWGYSWSLGGGGFTDSLNGFPYAGLLKPGDRHSQPPSLALFREPWSELPVRHKLH